MYQELSVEQGSPDWHRIRAGKVTPSRFSVIMRGSAAAKNTYLRELRSREVHQELNMPSLTWGKAHESAAYNQYCLATGYRARRAGFFVCARPGFECIAGSPDVVVHSVVTSESFDSCGYPRTEWLSGPIVSGAEIKCPFNPENHHRTRYNGCPDQYIWQVKGYMWLLGVSSWDFVSFDPRAEPAAQLFIQNIRLSDYERMQMDVKLDEFCRVYQRDSEFFTATSAAELVTVAKLPKLF